MSARPMPHHRCHPERSEGSLVISKGPSTFGFGMTVFGD
jgi:hypothetical protein